MTKFAAIGCGLIFLLIVVLASVVVSNVPKYSEASKNSGTFAPTSVPQKEYKVGESARLGDYQFTVDSSKRVKSIKYNSAPTGKEYVIITVTIKNSSSKEVSFSQYDFKMQDLNGAQMSMSIATYSLDDNITSGTLAADGKITGTLAFEIPTGSAAKLIYEPSFWSNKRVVVAL